LNQSTPGRYHDPVAMVSRTRARNAQSDCPYIGDGMVRSQTRTVRSCELEASRVPSGEKGTPRHRVGVAFQHGYLGGRDACQAPDPLSTVLIVWPLPWRPPTTSLVASPPLPPPPKPLPRAMPMPGCLGFQRRPGAPVCSVWGSRGGLEPLCAPPLPVAVRMHPGISDRRSAPPGLSVLGV
jgi:hypothetical protein